jgi:tight adherence protein C
MSASIAALLVGITVFLRLSPSAEARRTAAAHDARQFLARAQEAMGRLVLRALPTAWAQRLVFDIDRAGLPLPPASFALLWASAAVAMPVLVGLLTAGAGPMQRVLVLTAVLLGALAPRLYLGARLRARQRESLRELPLFLDLLRVAVEAGQGIDAALLHVSPHVAGPLGEELLRLLRRLRLGADREEAFAAFGRRVGCEEAHVLVAAILQAERTGGGLAQALASQAEYLRSRLRQRAQEEARRAPVKMLFPMAFCLLPAMMLLLMGPAAIDLMQSLREVR